MNDRTHSVLLGTVTRRVAPTWLASLLPAAFFLALIGCPTLAWSVQGVDGVTEKVVGTLSAQQAGSPREVLLSPTDCYDATTHMSLPLAVYLREQLAGPLQQAGFRLGEPQKEITKVWVLQCHWKRKGERLSITFVAAPWAEGRRGQVKIFSTWLPVTPDLESMLQPDLPSYGRTLVHRLALNDRLTQPRRVHLRPVQVSNVIGGRPSNDFFNTWLRDAVAESNLLIAVQTEKELAGLDKTTLRTRGIRPRAKPGLSLTGDLVAAQTELSGEVDIGEKEVLVKTALHDQTDQELSQASVNVPVGVLPADVVADLEGATTAPIEAEAPVSQEGLRVELSTSRGEGKATYRIGEQISFLVRVNRDAFVYLFDLDSSGAAALLYPAFGIKQGPLPAGQLLLLPDDGMPYELEVTTPPGKDLVWVVASETALDLPQELTEDWAKAEVLMERVRRMGTAGGAYAEAQVALYTLP